MEMKIRIVQDAAMFVTKMENVAGHIPSSGVFFYNHYHQRDRRNGVG